MAAPVLVWFRRDLRLADNPALAAAVTEGPVIPVYVLDETPGLRPIGAAGRWWLDKSLRALGADLEARGSRLVLRRGEAAKVIAGLAEQTGASRVVANRLHEPGAAECDRKLQNALGKSGVAFDLFEAALLLPEGAVATRGGEPFKVFTPFWRTARPLVAPGEPATLPRRLHAPERFPASESLDAWGLHPRRPDWSKGFAGWTPGEAGAKARLDRFLDEALADYPAGRDRPAREGTSRLSPHLHWGEIGPAQVWRALHAAAAERGLEGQAEKFAAELGWREFNHQLLAARPDLPSANYDARFDRLAWRDDAQALAAWKAGRTGYPVVDAGMRQLWATGWMHNRVRMIAASFLIKHLLIDWREGERWFWDTLVDADPANNAANWQWVAGSGADAAPFFRIFNPVLQGERFDPEGEYVRHWVPELAEMPADHIHAPWKAPKAELDGAGVRLGTDYPHPIVDHAAARARALAALKALPR